MSDRVKEHYGNLFGLPAEQIRFFDELTPAQVQEVRNQFTAGLVNVSNYVYAAKRDGRLVPRREARRPMIEMMGDWSNMVKGEYLSTVQGTD